jgi:hypothetical protein
MSFVSYQSGKNDPACTYAGESIKNLAYFSVALLPKEVANNSVARCVISLCTELYRRGPERQYVIKLVLYLRNTYIPHAVVMVIHCHHAIHTADHFIVRNSMSGKGFRLRALENYRTIGVKLRHRMSVSNTFQKGFPAKVLIIRVSGNRACA